MIKKIDVVSIIAFIAGFILVEIYIYKTCFEIDMLIPFLKIGIGSIIGAVVLSIISGIKKENKNITCISSYLTPFYKIILLPFFVSMTLLFTLIVYILLEKRESNELTLLYLSIVVLMFFTSYFYSKIVIKVKWLEYDKGTITIYGVFNAVTKPISDVISIEGDEFVFYKIEFYDKSVVYVFPKMYEYLINIGEEPDSIKKLKELIELNKNKSWK